MLKKIIILIFCCLFSAAAMSGCRTAAVQLDEISYLTPIPDDKTWYTQVEAREVLEQLSLYLHENHALFLMEKERIQEVENVYLKTWAAVPKNGMNKIQLVRTARHLLNPFHDAHLSVSPLVPQKEQRIYLTDLVIREKNGAVLKSVNGESIEDIFKRTEAWHSYELPEGAMNDIRNQLVTEFGFVLYGYNPAELTISVENPDGTESTMQYTKADFHDHTSHISILQNELKEININNAYYYVDVDEAKKTAILTLKACAYDDGYIAMLRQLFSTVAQKKIEYVIVDLRNNRGGHSGTANEFISYLDIDEFKDYDAYVRKGDQLEAYTDMFTKNPKKADVFKGKVYVLTNVKTFSSAMIFAELIQANHLGTIIGEIPGYTASSYGHVIMQEMPNYPFMMATTFVFFERPNSSTKQKLLLPDILCPANDALQMAYREIDKINSQKLENSKNGEHNEIEHLSDAE